MLDERRLSLPDSIEWLAWQRDREREIRTLLIIHLICSSRMLIDEMSTSVLVRFFRSVCSLPSRFSSHIKNVYLYIQIESVITVVSLEKNNARLISLIFRKIFTEHASVVPAKDSLLCISNEHGRCLKGAIFETRSGASYSITWHLPLAVN